MGVAYSRAVGKSLSSFQRLRTFEQEYRVTTGESYFGHQIFTHDEMEDPIDVLALRLRAQLLGHEVMELEPVIMG